ncbi:radical SAM protein [Candidatus Desantisbacteria bacterium]|nr:radical SAM protein [Candidatus Desantisbacteria bacterium]
MNNVLLVEPAFPYPTKSKNQANEIHRNFVPIGLLKLGAYYKSLGAHVYLERGNKSKENIQFNPNLILITSIFTYWSKYVWSAVEHYRSMFPKAKIIVGGIYATLHNDMEYFQNKLKQYSAECYVGLHLGAENFYPDYSLLNGEIDHHVTHAMRGCIRKCAFCGTWKIEPDRYDKTSEDLIKELKEIGKNKVIFFDNNFLANRHIKQNLKVLASLRLNEKSVVFESQSGFDGRLLEKDSELAELLKKTRFQNIRIAWDNSFADYSSIKVQVDSLVAAGYNAKDISVFMIYNFSVPYDEMLKKLKYCKKLGVQITDCRFRPLDSIEDNYNSQKSKDGQTENDYYIHTKAGWTDKKIRDFRKSIREHNIWIRYAKDKGLSYDKEMEKWSRIHNIFKFFKMGRPPQLEVIENSPTWKSRLLMMSKVKNYCKKNNITTLNFSTLSNKYIDEELKKLIKIFNKNQMETEKLS